MRHGEEESVAAFYPVVVGFEVLYSFGLVHVGTPLITFPVTTSDLHQGCSSLASKKARAKPGGVILRSVFVLSLRPP
jgi:hypothetical protein